MAKVTFEFDDTEEPEDIILVTNRHKLQYAIDKLDDFYRKLYNGKLYASDIISVKDNKVLTEEDYDKYRETGDYPVSGTKRYINTDDVENILDEILYDVRHLLSM